MVTVGRGAVGRKSGPAVEWLHRKNRQWNEALVVYSFSRGMRSPWAQSHITHWRHSTVHMQHLTPVSVYPPPPIHIDRRTHTNRCTFVNVYTPPKPNTNTPPTHHPACRSKMPWTTGRPTWVAAGPPGVTARKAGGTARTDTATSRSAAGLHGHATWQQSPTRSVGRGFAVRSSGPWVCW